MTLENQKTDEMYNLKLVTKYREVTAAEIRELEAMYEMAARLVETLGFSEDAVSEFRSRSECFGNFLESNHLRERLA